MAQQLGPPRTTFNILNTPRAAANALRQPKRSTWMINIGTHRKPWDDHEYQLYRDSLYRVLARMFDDPNHRTRFYYPVRQMPNGDFLMLTEQRDTMELGEEEVNVIVERGTVTGRIDAHALVTIEHTGPLIRFDHNNFADDLQFELDLENGFFSTDETPIFARTRPGYQNEKISWPTEGRPYVSFRSIARFNNFQALAYMTKQHRGDTIYDDEYRALTNLVGELRDRVRTRGARGQLA